MNKKIFFSVLAVVILGYFYFSYNSKTFSPKDATYIIQGQQVTLKSGESRIKLAPNSASEIVTRYFGNEVKYDFDKDGREDLAFLLTQNTGGSGTFYYVAIALNKKQGALGSEAMFLGDRIAPQSTNINDKGLIVVNYADRKPGESFAVSPSVGKSIWVKFNPKDMTLGEVVQNFEGEADVSKMSLTMKTWNWVRTEYNDGKVIIPKSDKFKLTFKSKNEFGASTDCNGIGGNYVVNGNKIEFKDMISTLMYCEGSQESDFSKMLQNTTSYLFTSKGELVLELKYDSGVVIFR